MAGLEDSQDITDRPLATEASEESEEEPDGNDQGEEEEEHDECNSYEDDFVEESDQGESSEQQENPSEVVQNLFSLKDSLFDAENVLRAKVLRMKQGLQAAETELKEKDELLLKVNSQRHYIESMKRVQDQYKSSLELKEKELQEVLVDLRERNAQLLEDEELLLTKEKEISILKASLEAEIQQRAELEQLHTQEHDENVLNLQLLMSEVKNMEARLREKNEEINSKEQQIEQLEKEAGRQDELVEYMRQQLEAKEIQQQMDMQEKITALNRRLEEYKKMLREDKDSQRKLQMQLQKQKEILVNHQKESRSLDERNSQLQQTLAQCERDLKSKNELIVSSAKKLQLLEEQNYQLRNHLNALVEAIKSLQLFYQHHEEGSTPHMNGDSKSQQEDDEDFQVVKRNFHKAMDNIGDCSRWIQKLQSKVRTLEKDLQSKTQKAQFLEQLIKEGQTQQHSSPSSGRSPSTTRSKLDEEMKLKDELIQFYQQRLLEAKEELLVTQSPQIFSENRNSRSPSSLRVQPFSNLSSLSPHEPESRVLLLRQQLEEEKKAYETSKLQLKDLERSSHLQGKDFLVTLKEQHLSYLKPKANTTPTFDLKFSSNNGSSPTAGSPSFLDEGRPDQELHLEGRSRDLDKLFNKTSQIFGTRTVEIENIRHQLARTEARLKQLKQEKEKE